MGADVLELLMKWAWELRGFHAEILSSTCRALRDAYRVKKPVFRLNVMPPRHLWYQKKDRLKFTFGRFAGRNGRLIGIDRCDAIVKFEKSEEFDEDIRIVRMDYVAQAAVPRE